MSTIALAPAAVSRLAINPVVCRCRRDHPHLYGGVGHDGWRLFRCATSRATCRRRVIDAEWILTSYLAANATILPISGWLSARLAGGTIS